MSVNAQTTDHLQATLTVHIPVEEYQATLSKELQNYKNKAQLKGFRKGKTPVDLIKKLYGNAILKEVVENSLQKQLYDHIRQNNINLLGQPLMNAEQADIYYNIQEPVDYAFRFDIGYAPDFEIQGLDHEFGFYKIIPSQESIDKEFENLRTRMGELKTVDLSVEESHLVDFSAAELDEQGLKEGGVLAELSLWISQVDGPAKASILGRQKGAEIDLDLRELHVDKDDEFIRKRYLTSLEEGHPVPARFRLTIKDIRANEPAVTDQAFFDKAFGPDKVKDLDEAKNFIKGILANQYISKAEALLFRDIQDHLLKTNKQDLPDAFLKRWLKSQNPKLSDEGIEAEYDDFALNLLWTIIRDKLIKKFNITVSPEEIKARFRQQILNYFGGMAMGDTAFLEPVIQRMMQRQEEVEKQHDEIMSDKVFDSLQATVPLAEKDIAETDFEVLMEQARQEAAARRDKATQAHAHHDHDHDHDHDHSGHSH